MSNNNNCKQFYKTRNKLLMYFSTTLCTLSLFTMAYLLISFNPDKIEP